MMMPSFEESARLGRKIPAARRVFDAREAQKSLPLVRQVLAEIAATTAQISRSERTKRVTVAESWSDRQILFDTDAEIEKLKQAVAAAREELHGIGVIVESPGAGVAAFPTIINGALAYFIYHLDDDRLKHWRYRDESKLRPIPPRWLSPPFIPFDEGEGMVI